MDPTVAQLELRFLATEQGEKVADAHLDNVRSKYVIDAPSVLTKESYLQRLLLLDHMARRIDEAEANMAETNARAAAAADAVVVLPVQSAGAGNFTTPQAGAGAEAPAAAVIAQS